MLITGQWYRSKMTLFVFMMVALIKLYLTLNTAAAPTKLGLLGLLGLGLGYRMWSRCFAEPMTLTISSYLIPS